MSSTRGLRSRTGEVCGVQKIMNQVVPKFMESRGGDGKGHLMIKCQIIEKDSLKGTMNRV